MKQKLTLSLLFLFTLVSIRSATAQSISPVETTEFCPNTNTTFTVVVPGFSPDIGVIGGNATILGGISITSTSSTSTTFTFVGKFGDANIKQTFRVNYWSGTSYLSHDFDFKRIKSFLYQTSTSCSITSISAVTAARCQVVNIPISFSNVQYSNPFESPALCFGTITAYEYKLPAGWSIGATVSTGSNWIPGSNSVTVTSDASSGVGGAIIVRPAVCSSGLTNNQVTAIIPINRPAPTLVIPETVNVVCSGDQTYTITGLPSGATTTWSITNNNSVATIGTATNTSIKVSRYGTQKGEETLTATVTHCSFTYTVNKVVQFGPSDAIVEIYNQYPSEVTCYQTDAFYIFRAALISGLEPFFYQWSYRVTGTTSETIITPDSYDGIFIFSSPGTYDIIARTSNGCGVGSNEAIKTITVDFGCWGAKFSLSTYPNPSSSVLNVSIEKEALEVQKLSKSEKISYKLIDIKNARTVKEWIFANISNTKQLNIAGTKPGNYILVVKKGNYQQSQKIIIN